MSFRTNGESVLEISNRDRNIFFSWVTTIAKEGIVPMISQLREIRRYSPVELISKLRSAKDSICSII